MIARSIKRCWDNCASDGSLLGDAAAMKIIVGLVVILAGTYCFPGRAADCPPGNDPRVCARAPTRTPPPLPSPRVSREVPQTALSERFAPAPAVTRETANTTPKMQRPAPLGSSSSTVAAPAQCQNGNQQKYCEGSMTSYGACLGHYVCTICRSGSWHTVACPLDSAAASTIQVQCQNGIHRRYCDGPMTERAPLFQTGG